MMKSLKIAILTTLTVFSFSAFGNSNMTIVESNHDVATTANKLVTVLESKGMKIFNQVDHAAGAESVGETLRPTTLVIFGNPKVGTKLMQCSQSMGLDLPLKMLIWQDAEEKVWLGYNDASSLASRHALSGCEGVVEKVNGALMKFSTAATQ